MFNKLYIFYDSYKDLLKFVFVLFFILILLCFIIIEFDKHFQREIDIIEKTKDYTIFESCKKINDKYYCWED